VPLATHPPDTMDRREIALAVVAGLLVTAGATNAVNVHQSRLDCEAMDARPDVTANCHGLLHDLSFWGSVLVAIAGLAVGSLLVARRGRGADPTDS
jgi:hypothetical protein